VPEEVVATAQLWIDAEDEWREVVAELFALGRPLSSAEQEDRDLAARRVDDARARHIAAVREWARTQD
jgi:hypothetical protein